MTPLTIRLGNPLAALSGALILSALVAGWRPASSSTEEQSRVAAADSAFQVPQFPRFQWDLPNTTRQELEEGVRRHREESFRAEHAALAHHPQYVSTLHRSSMSEPGCHYGKSAGRIKAYLKSGVVIGYLIAKCPPGNPLSQVGFKTGDIVLAQDDHLLDGPESLSGLYRGFRDAEDMHFLIERDGKRRCLLVHLVD